MGNALRDKTVLVVGRGGGIARAVTLLAQSEGARVIVAERDQVKLAAAYDHPGIDAESLYITDDESIVALAHNPSGRIGTPDDIAGAVSFAMTNTFMTGMTLRVDGGEPLT